MMMPHLNGIELLKHVKNLYPDIDTIICTGYSQKMISSSNAGRKGAAAKEALDMALKEKPDIIFLDVTMPGLDGRDVCKKIRNTPGDEIMYIIMLTAKNQQFDRLLGFEVGADQYVTKPCDIDYLLRAVEKVQKKAQR